MNISFDGFIRTTDASHKNQVRRFVELLKEKDAVYLGKFEGWWGQPALNTRGGGRGGGIPNRGAPMYVIRHTQLNTPIRPLLRDASKFTRNPCNE